MDSGATSSLAKCHSVRRGLHASASKRIGPGPGAAFGLRFGRSSGSYFCWRLHPFFRLTAIWDEWCWMVGSSRYTVSSVCVSFCIGVCVFCLLVFNIFLSFAATGQQMAGGGRWQRISLQYIASWTWIPWWFFFCSKSWWWSSTSFLSISQFSVLIKQS